MRTFDKKSVPSEGGICFLNGEICLPVPPPTLLLTYEDFRKNVFVQYEVKKMYSIIVDLFLNDTMREKAQACFHNQKRRLQQAICSKQ